MADDLRTRFSVLMSAEGPSGVRALITMLLVGGMLWMQWHSPVGGKVPEGLVSAASVAAGFYLGQQDASQLMRALLSILFVTVAVAFYVQFGWLPESVNGQVSTVVGVYFGRRLSGPPPSTRAA